jgi:hypothetical protein
MQVNFIGCASVPMFRKQFVDEVGGYNSTLEDAKPLLGEDWELMLRVAARHAIVAVPEILMGYRHRPGSMSTACDTMWRHHQIVMRQLRKSHPELKPALFPAGNRRFCLYMAGQEYRSGRMAEAIRWASRSGISMPLRLGPHVLRMILFPKPKPEIPQVMRAGEMIDTSRVPEPRLPYGRILAPE